TVRFFFCLCALEAYEFAIRDRIVRGVYQRLGCLKMSQVMSFKGIANEQRRGIAQDLIESGDRLSAGADGVLATKNRRGKHGGKCDGLHGDLNEPGAGGIRSYIIRRYWRAVLGRQGTQESHI